MTKSKLPLFIISSFGISVAFLHLCLELDKFSMLKCENESDASNESMNGKIFKRPYPRPLHSTGLPELPFFSRFEKSYTHQGRNSLWGRGGRGPPKILAKMLF